LNAAARWTSVRYDPYSSYRSRRSWSYDDEESDDEGEAERASDYEMGEVYEESLSLDHWSDRHGKKVPFGEIDVRDEEIVSEQPRESSTTVVAPLPCGACRHCLMSCRACVLPNGSRIAPTSSTTSPGIVSGRRPMYRPPRDDSPFPEPAAGSPETTQEPSQTLPSQRVSHRMKVESDAASPW
jgi:hypothetical protein